jgi:hypothetical protein
MADIFLSYSREDHARAEQVAQGLAAAGLDVFWDTEIPPGQTWADYIENKLAQCKALIVLWSEHSTKSQWVREEARMGRDKGVLIPVMMDGSSPPFGFGEVQAADLSHWNGESDNPNWRRLVEAVKAFEGAERSTQRPMAAPPHGSAAHAPQAGASPQQGWAPQAAASAQKRGVPAWVWIVGAVVAALFVLGMLGNAYNQQQAQQQALQQAGAGPSGSPAMQAPQQPAAAAPNQYQQQVLARLSQAQQSFLSQGYQQIGQISTGQLGQGQYQNIPLTLTSAGDFRIVGVCDDDCGDLDLGLYDQSANLVSQDNQPDATPIISVQLQAPQQFTLQVVMHACRNSPCLFALALYGRPLQAGAQ